MILTPEKVLALVPIENPTLPKYVIKISSAQGLTRSNRCYTVEEFAYGGKKNDLARRPTSQAKIEEFLRKI